MKGFYIITEQERRKHAKVDAVAGIIILTLLGIGYVVGCYYLNIK